MVSDSNERPSLADTTDHWLDTHPLSGQAAGGESLALRDRWVRRARSTLKAFLFVLLGYYVLCLLLLAGYRFVDPPVTGVQLQRTIEARLAGENVPTRRPAVAYARLPQHVSRAVVAAEDGRFWRHWGFDFAEMRTVAGGVLQGQQPRGASTITQQLVKNLFGTTHRNPVRKAYDFSLTIPAELLLGKERILELYLNNVEWGPGIFGIDAGARYHYRTSAPNLSRTQAAGLAALLPNPRARTPANTAWYRSEILRRMARRGW
jgi:monofunctional glycosyltransferase